MKRLAALLAVAGLVASTMPAATAGAKTRTRTAAAATMCGGDHYIPFTQVKFPLC